MPNTKTYIVNPDKLSRELEKRGLVKATASREMGFCESYLSQVMQRGVISKVAARALESTYNIRLADYALKEATPELVAPLRLYSLNLITRNCAISFTRRFTPPLKRHGRNRR